MKKIKEARMQRFSNGVSRFFEDLVEMFVKTCKPETVLTELDRSSDKDLIKGFKVTIPGKDVILFKLLTVSGDVIYKINDLASGICWIGAGEEDLDTDIQDLCGVVNSTETAITESLKESFQEESDITWSDDETNTFAQAYVDDSYEDLSLENVRADLENEPYFYMQQEEIDEEEDEEVAEEMQMQLNAELDAVTDAVWEKYQKLLNKSLDESKRFSEMNIADGFVIQVKSGKSWVTINTKGKPNGGEPMSFDTEKEAKKSKVWKKYMDNEYIEGEDIRVTQNTDRD